MRRIVPLAAAVLALAACNQQGTPQESAEDFAARIGQGGASDPAEPAPVPTVAQAAPPAGADVTALEKLGNVAGVDLGPRAGGCTLMVGETELLMAGAPAGEAHGKGVIRVGNGLVMLDTGPGGLATVKRGGTFTGDGVTVSLAAAPGTAQIRNANVTVTSAAGKSKAYSGRWVCS